MKTVVLRRHFLVSPIFATIPEHSFTPHYPLVPTVSHAFNQQTKVKCYSRKQQVALNYLDSQPRPGKIEARLLKKAGVK